METNLMPLPTTVSDDTRRLNPSLYECTAPVSGGAILSPRIKQRQKPKLNKLEMEVQADLRAKWNVEVLAHAITLELANGCKYTPDLVVKTDELRLIEVKGKHSWDDAIVKLKVAARQWPQFSFILADKPGYYLRYYPVLA